MHNKSRNSVGYNNDVSFQIDDFSRPIQFCSGEFPNNGVSHEKLLDANVVT